MHVIVFPSVEGPGVCIMTPYTDCGLSTAEIAEKDVPTGTPYRIMDADNLPDRSRRDEWLWDAFKGVVLP